jgi:adenylate cyclase
LLDDCFDCVARPLTRMGGEILKFMGDGMLAMMPIASADERMAVAARATQAAVAAQRMIAALNLMRVTVDEPSVRFGLALHVGEVMFGNIGASARLDFTVIGPAVNYAARLEKLCASLNRQIVVSSTLAALLPERDVVPLGRHTLKDLDDAQPIYGLSASPG